MGDFSLIVSSVCKYFNTSIEELKSNRTTAHLTLARGLFYYLVKQNQPSLSDEKIARFFNRERTACAYGRSKVEGFLESNDTQTIKAYNRISKDLGKNEVLEIPLKELTDGDLMTVKKMLIKPDWDRRNKEAIDTINAEVDRLSLIHI